MQPKDTGELREAIVGTLNGLRERARTITPAMSEARHRARSVAESVQENPLGLLLGAAAVGFLVGSLLPATGSEEDCPQEQAGQP